MGEKNLKFLLSAYENMVGRSCLKIIVLFFNSEWWIGEKSSDTCTNLRRQFVGLQSLK